MLRGVSLLITTHKNTTRPRALVPKLRRDEWYSHFSWGFAYCIVWTSIVLVVSRLMELKRGGGCSNVLFSFIYLFQAFIFIFIYLFLSVISESLTWDRHGEESQMSTMMGTTAVTFSSCPNSLPKAGAYPSCHRATLWTGCRSVAGLTFNTCQSKFCRNI